MRDNEHPLYNPDLLLDALKAWLGLRSDSALAQQLRVSQTTLSKIRHRRATISADILLWVHEATALAIRDLRFLSGDFRWHTRPSSWSVSSSVAAWQLSEAAHRFAGFARRGRRTV